MRISGNRLDLTLDMLNRNDGMRREISGERERGDTPKERDEQRIRLQSWQASLLTGSFLLRRRCFRAQNVPAVDENRSHMA